MTSAGSNNNKNSPGGAGSRHSMQRRGIGPKSDGPKAQFFLMVACTWPLIALFFILFTSQPSQEILEDGQVINNTVGFKLRKLMDRVDIVGYGPTHPRVAVVIVGDEENKQRVITSVESVFGNTDLKRLFVVVAVMDGMEEDEGLEETLSHIDNGGHKHWNGMRPGLGAAADSSLNANHHQDGRTKIHVLYSKKKQGFAASRSDAVDFISILEKKHLQAGIKSPEEDLILLLLQSGTTLRSRKWLNPVTSALIVPPPLIGANVEDNNNINNQQEEEDAAVALKISNAIAFGHVDEKAVAFDYSFKPMWVAPSGKDLALSNGDSYPTPALSGAATALRLDTFKSLPAQDLSLEDEWQANLDLSLNLWMCGDGIDVLRDVKVKNVAVNLVKTGKPLDPNGAARFAAAWMDPQSQVKVLDKLAMTHHEFTQLEWDTHVSRAKIGPEFPVGLTKRCRPFTWFEQEVNPFMDEEDIPTAKRGKKKAKVVTKGSSKSGAQQVTKKVLTKISNTIIKKVSTVAKKNPPKVKKPETKKHNMKKDKKVTEKQIPSTPAKKPKLPLPNVSLPKVPLRKLNLEIVQQAAQVPLKFVDVSGGHKEHPHMGATDENGKYGYVHDETFLKKKAPKFDFPHLVEACNKKDNTYRMLTEQVYVDFNGDKEASKQKKKRDKIFCLVYTIDKSHDRVPYILETWGPKCDGFMVGSNKTDPSIGATNIPHEGPEEYNNIWQKVRSMWSYIYDNYYEKYDWFHIGGDDVYLLVENLRLYLESEEIQTAQNGGTLLPSGGETAQTPLFLGRRFAYQGNMNEIFNSGGSGYTLNKASLKLLVTEGFPKYFPHLKTFSEDTMVAKVLRKFNVVPYDTKDEVGGERYMPFMPGHHWGYQFPKNKKDDWYARYSIDIKMGKDHCAKKSVAFHYVKMDAQKRLHALLYGLCPKQK